MLAFNLLLSFKLSKFINFNALFYLPFLAPLHIMIGRAKSCHLSSQLGQTGTNHGLFPRFLLFFIDSARALRFFHCFFSVTSNWPNVFSLFDDVIG